MELVFFTTAHIALCFRLEQNTVADTPVFQPLLNTAYSTSRPSMLLTLPHLLSLERTQLGQLTWIKLFHIITLTHKIGLGSFSKVQTLAGHLFAGGDCPCITVREEVVGVSLSWCSPLHLSCLSWPTLSFSLLPFQFSPPSLCRGSDRAASCGQS